MCVAPWWQALQEELRGRRQQASSLQEISAHLLLDAAGDDSAEAQEKVHVVSNRLDLLRRRLVPNSAPTVLSSGSTGGSVCFRKPARRNRPGQERRATDARTWQHPGGKVGSSWLRAGFGLNLSGCLLSCREERRDSPPRRSLFSRVLRAAVPLHLLFLVLLLLACLVPLSEDDHHSCALSNNFARSFYPMLRYTNGPPPT